MDSLSPQVVSVPKLPILNPNEFNFWKMRIEQYFLMTDYSLWEVILNGDSPVPTRIVEGILQPVSPTTAEQKLARKNELKARSTLLMALVDKHQLKFNSHKDAKTLMEGIEKRFGGNTETKKRNKADLEEQSLDDLFNSLKIYEAEVKHSSSTGTTTQNLAFVSSSNTDNTTESLSATASVFAVCAKMHVSSLPNVDSLSNTMAMLTMRARRFLQKTCINLSANGPTSMGFDMSKVKCYNCHIKGNFARECRSPKDSRWNCAAEPQRRTVPRRSMLIILLLLFHLRALFLIMRFQPSDGYHAVPPPYTGTFIPPKPDLVFNTSPTAVETNHSAFSVQLSPTKPAQALHSVQRTEKTIPATTPKPASPKPASSGKRRNRKACFVCKSMDHLIKDCDYHAKKMAQPTPRNHAHRGNHKQNAPLTHTNPQKHMVPAAVLTQSKLETAVRPVSVVMPKFRVTQPRHVKPYVTKFKSPIRRHLTRSHSPKTINSPPRVTVVKDLVVSAAQGMQGK
nr:hypothetical protein [Tanacetum cinerariifolium]